MKSLVKLILIRIMLIFSKLYSYDLDLWLQNKKNLLYTMWISNFIGEVGKNVVIDYPCKLWGGGERNIKIGNNTRIQSGCILGCWIQYNDDKFSPSIEIGDNCNIGEYTHMTSINKISIGNGLLTGRYVYIGDNSHGNLSIEDALVPPIRRKLLTKGPVSIGNNVWIGDKVTILAGVTIGDNSIIGANSVVTRNIPPNSVWAGNPAKEIRRIDKID